VGGGTLDRLHGGGRYGGRVGEKMDYRVWGKGFEHEAFKMTNGSGARESWQSRHGGVRTDWRLTSRDALTVQGEFYQLSEEELADRKQGGDLLMRWTRQLPHAADFSLQFFYDRNVQPHFEESDIYDLDWHHRFRLTQGQEINWGLGFRQVDIRLENGSLISWQPPARSDRTVSLFVQDEIALAGNDLKLTVGSKVEHNDYTGLEWQPGARLLWHVAEGHTLWSALSRAVRIPSYTDTGFHLVTPLTPATTLRIQGNPEFSEETVWAYELGYRTQPAARLSLDVAAFHNRYDNLGTYENQPASFNPVTRVVTLGQTFANKAKGSTHGLETAVNWQAMDHWKLRASHTWLKMNLNLVDNSTDTSTVASANDIPRHQWQIRSYLDLPHDLELDAALYHVAPLTHLDIPALARLDLRLGWRAGNNVRFSLSAHNLLDGQHPEFQGTSIRNSEIPRSYFARLDWSF
ncbi:MAG: TonB-dependent receptor, partial [Magnetococcales bacterium]|nr:TonB-dependent receptor [Magnetococcales bacterium]